MPRALPAGTFAAMDHLTLLVLHNALRWPLFLLLVCVVSRAAIVRRWPMTANAMDRPLTTVLSGVAHAQFLLGIVVYEGAPFANAFFKLKERGFSIAFFALLHPAAMFVAVVFITIGVAKAKRGVDERARSKALLMWCGAALILLVLFIPWPFSPLAMRPSIRTF